MAYVDLHSKPFDEATIAKLEIFEDYFEAWLPVFVMQSHSKICIFDFFSGTGYDKNGIPGSPIRFLQKTLSQIGNIFQQKVKPIFYFNEFDKNKFQLLKSSCDAFLQNHPDLNRAIKVEYSSEDFEIAFKRLLPEIRNFPSLVFLDQNGVKFLSNRHLLEFERHKGTDFISFISSSYFRRFGESEEFKKYLEIDMEFIKKEPYKFIHRNLIKQLKDKLPLNTKLKLYPFSIKKGTNIYGIIFGAKHPLAVDKFLSLAWKRDEISGDANFDIDDNNSKQQLDIFVGKKLSRKEEFSKALEEALEKGEIKNNEQALNFAYTHGHTGTHAAEVLKSLKGKKIFYEGRSPLVTYSNVFKDRRLIDYKLLK